MERSEALQGDFGSASSTIGSSNIGFQLLKKHGWKEGTGLGISEQGRLEPVKAYLKNGKRGLGAEKEKIKRPAVKHPCSVPLEAKFDQPKFQGGEHLHPNKSKALSKRHRKMQEFEKQLQEKEFERAFFREFWPDNV